MSKISKTRTKQHYEAQAHRRKKRSPDDESAIMVSGILEDAEMDKILGEGRIDSRGGWSKHICGVRDDDAGETIEDDNDRGRAARLVIKPIRATLWMACGDVTTNWIIDRHGVEENG
ncbi:hypothetical protein CYMTET_11863 [Cymbomonas tetramitiformis]|uniref:Uncharacterized protein n=1 Tax=Cymbomonas tetramitiformis TaxID=36881 RepID=A0AAE0GLS0_9CHLO|nr:hypothetical protein CYMTET_11863 [Cymbomonas tetramitiformis]